MKKLIAVLAMLTLCLGLTAVVYADEDETACNHALGEGTTMVLTEEAEADCTESGCKAYYECSECKAYYCDAEGKEIADIDAWKQGEGLIPALGHDYKGTVTREADCKKDGVMTYVCSRCDDKYTEAIPATGHTLYYGVCTKCGYVSESVVQRSNGNWYYVVDNQVQWNYTGIRQNQYGWWRIVNGKVDFTCESVEQNEWGWWYISGGKVQFDYTGIRPNQYGWWRIVNGKVDFTCNSVEQNEYGWWKLEGGKVNFDYYGIAQNANGWWKIDGGKVNFDYYGLAQNEWGWWYLEGGKVNFGFNGLAQNEWGWWYLEGGQVQFWYTGIASNEYGYWYCRNGQVDFSYTGSVTATINGVTKTWMVYNGQVSLADTLDKMNISAQNYSSSTNYLIMVDCYANKFGIYYGYAGHWSQIAYWDCSTGAPGTETPKGVNYINYNCGYSFDGEDKDYTCYYYSGYKAGGYLIHSTLYVYHTFTDLDPRLGDSLSHGCIRLNIWNAKWVYENIPYGTTVVTY